MSRSIQAMQRCHTILLRCVAWQSRFGRLLCLPRSVYQNKSRRKHVDEQNNNVVILKIYKLIIIAHFLLRLSTPWPAQGCADIGQPLNANCHCLFFVTKDAKWGNWPFNSLVNPGFCHPFIYNPIFLVFRFMSVCVLLEYNTLLIREKLFMWAAIIDKSF